MRQNPSSGQIRDALVRLDEISGKMTTSIEETLKLIQITLEKVTQTGENVEKITTDSTKLGDHIQGHRQCDETYGDLQFTPG